MEPTIAKSLLDIIKYRAQYQPDKLAYIFLQNGEIESGRLTYGDLDRQAKAIAFQLQSWQGERALLLYPSGLEFVAAFFGCLYAGIVAVPVYPPKRNRKLSRLLGITQDAQAKIALTTSSILANITRRREQESNLLLDLKLIATDTIKANGQDFELQTVNPESLALLQYTSGSTGKPKGVMVTHSNIIHNQQIIAQAFGHSNKSIVVGWLPLFHDMGLIGNVLQPIYLGITCILMPPVAFLQKPIRWLQTISQYRATTSGGPNFAYDLCVNKIDSAELSNLDLSSWDLAFNGAEVVRAKTIEKFSKKFASCGFKNKAFYPCYGMAETTLLVTGGEKKSQPLIKGFNKEINLESNSLVESEIASPESKFFVGCGRPYLDTQVMIVNPELLTPCETGKVGEIWVSGKSNASGYWHQPEATAETFQAYIQDCQDTPWLRTGDLGFFSNEELFITGRIKDLIIIRGKNFYPQDLELTVEKSNSALRSHCSAAFSVEIAREERLVVTCEVKRTELHKLDSDEIVSQIRQAVSEEHDLQIYAVLLLKPATIPKTSSGKIQRHACKTGFLNCSLDVVARSILEDSVKPEADKPQLNPEILSKIAPEERLLIIEKYLHSLISKVLQIDTDQLNKQEPLSSFGLDSLASIEIKNQIGLSLKITVPPDEFLYQSNIIEIAQQINQQLTEDAVNLNNYVIETNTLTDISDLDLFNKCRGDGGYFGSYRLSKDQYFTQPILEGNPKPRMTFQGKKVITWSINNYLGIVGREEIRQAAHQALEDFGTWTPMGSRMLTGNTQKHLELEQRLAQFCQKPASIVFNYGYMGVLGSISALIEQKDQIIIDSQSHACIVDSALLSSVGKQFRVFNHNDLDSLESQLKAANQARRGGILIVTEGVFGMSGEVAPLPEICALKEQYGARLMVDDAHGFGIMGKTGKGTGEYLNIQSQIDLYFGTFAKSFAAIGGVTAGEEMVVDYIRYNARTNVFAKSLPLIYVEAVTAALNLIENEPELREKMWRIAKSLQEGLRELGFDLGKTQSPITPVYVPAGDEKTGQEIMSMLREEYGVFVSGVTYPVVPQGIFLFRLIPTASHTDEDVELTLQGFKAVRDRLKI